MWFTKVLCWPRGTSKSTTGGRPAVGRPPKFHPRLEALEDRLVPAVFNVTSLLDSNAAGSGSLRRAITDANATAGPNQVNILTPGTYRLTLIGPEDSNKTGDLDITNSVTITNQSGGTAVIDAGGLTTLDRVIQIFPAVDTISVKITGVTIQGGNRPPTGGPGGGILVQFGSSLTLDHDIVQNNTTSENGGGIAVLAGKIDLEGTTVRNNTGAEGGGIFVTGPQAALTVNNSLLANNSSTSTLPDAGGGGITLRGVGDVFITNSEIAGNKAAGDGGGLLISGPSDVTITGSEVIGNTASGSGGGLQDTDSFELSIRSSTFANNRADLGGGGLHLLGAVDFTLTNVTISGNKARLGGGILNESSVGGTLLNDTIVFNSATMTGGGVLSSSTQGSVTLVNTIVARNTATGGKPDVDNGGRAANLFDFAANFIGDNTGAADSFPAGASNAEGSFVGTGAAPLDPLLEPLADNGGTVVFPDGSHLLTHEGRANSGNNGVRNRGRGVGFIRLGAPSLDERGLPRPFNGPVDIGASQFQNFDLAVSTSGPAGALPAGQPATFTLTVRNLGPNPARGATVTATLLPGTVVVSAPAGFTVSGNVVTFAVPDLAAGGSTSLTLTVIPAATGPFTATAILSGHDDPNRANNTASASVEVLPRPFPATGSADVTALVKIVRQGRRRPKNRLLFRITNVSGTPIQGPLGLVVAGLPPRGSTRLLNASGRSAGRQQFVRIDTGGDNLFDPGESVMVQLVFAQPFNPRRLTVLAGAFA
jgi:uncharacterized repeat protein (TIGR01451 family)